MLFLKQGLFTHTYFNQQVSAGRRKVGGYMYRDVVMTE